MLLIGPRHESAEQLRLVTVVVECLDGTSWPSRLRDPQGALSALREILNLIHEVHFGGSVLFEGLHRIGDADALVAFLRLGAKADKERRDRLRAGRPLPGDFEE